MEFLNLEVIVGTYEQFVLGYQVSSADDGCRLDQVFAIHSHNASVRSLATAGKYAASGGADEVIQLYDMTRKKCAGALTQHDGTVTALAFTPTGSHLLSGSEDGSVAVCRAGSWQLEKFWRQAHKGSAAVSLSCHPTGKLALSLGTDGILRTWNMVKGRLAYAKNLGSANRRLVTCVVWSLKGNWYVVVVGSKANVYSIATAEITYSIDYGKKISSVCFVKNNVLCVGDDAGAIHTVNVVKKKKLGETAAHGSRVKCMSGGSVSGHVYLASASSSGQIKLWSYKKCALSMVCSVESGCRITCLVTSHISVDDKDSLKEASGKKARSDPVATDSEPTVVDVEDGDLAGPRGKREPGAGLVKVKRKGQADKVTGKKNKQSKKQNIVTEGEVLTVAGLAKVKRKGQADKGTGRKHKRPKKLNSNIEGEVVNCTPGQAWSVEDV
ncbi:p21-activated protein kinase-interacting protein 1-like [Bacillus rossius redtenbacheri]|uniref:p21-activated protein kinase-interacting protein 1-like n=1 Tax=Bacillus rossius redtenbacheri TaxID=93214 RepID=UPI002FDD1DCA